MESPILSGDFPITWVASFNFLTKAKRDAQSHARETTGLMRRRSTSAFDAAATPRHSRHRAEGRETTPTTQVLPDRAAPETQEDAYDGSAWTSSPRSAVRKASDEPVMDFAMPERSCALDRADSDDESEERAAVDFDAYDATVWRSASRDGLQGFTTATPMRALLPFVGNRAYSSPRSLLASASKQLFSAGAHMRAMDTTEAGSALHPSVLATPTQRSVDEVTIAVHKVDLRCRRVHWAMLRLATGSTVEDVSLRAQRLWGCGHLVWYRQHANADASLIAPLTVVLPQEDNKALEWYCQEACDDGEKHSGHSYQVCYHVIADVNGHLALALPVALASTANDARRAPAVSAAHQEYLLDLDVLAAAKSGTSTLALVPIPAAQQQVGASGNDFALQFPIAVIHPALRPGDLVLWHRGLHLPPRHCSVVALTTHGGLATATVNELGTMIAHEQVLVVDLERLW